MIIGQVVTIKKGFLHILTQTGIGYKVNITNSFLCDLCEGQEIKIYTYLKVSENALDLYGFKTLEDKEFFEMLISVKGIGPKGALNILGLGSILEIKKAINRGDVNYLTQVSGIGKKTAERLVVELKNKTQSNEEEMIFAKGNVLGEVVDGLVTMGYSREEAREAIKGIENIDKTTEELMKIVLKSFSR